VALSHSHAFVSKKELEDAIRTHALDMLWTHLGPTFERLFAKKTAPGALKIRALQLLWEIGRDPTVRTEMKSLHARIDVDALQQLLAADPKLRAYLEQNPDVARKLLPAEAIPAERGSG
jgi:hypothetical protein